MQDAVANYGYLVDDNTGQPEVECLMDNQTGAILGLSAVVITKATKTTTPLLPKRSPASTTKPIWPTVLPLTRFDGKCKVTYLTIQYSLKQAIMACQ